MKRFYTILKTELKLSIRGMDMIIFAICMPLVVISLLGIIFGSRPAYPGAGYTFLEQSFGAVSAIAVCAGGVMGLPLVISEYRQKKILKRYQVTPAVRPSFWRSRQRYIPSIPWHPWLWSMLRRSFFSGRVFRAQQQRTWLYSCL